MDALTISIIALVAFFILMCFRLPIAFAFALVGGVGTVLVKGWGPGLTLLGKAPYVWATNGALLALPLFILMGQFVFYSGISSELSWASSCWSVKPCRVMAPPRQAATHTPQPLHRAALISATI